MTWRNLAHEEGEEKKPMFDHPERQGAKELKEAGYVEQPEFSKSVLGQILKGNLTGYFCANCEYFNSQGEEDGFGYCHKLSASDKFFGCCNLWEYDKHAVDVENDKELLKLQITNEKT